MWKIQNKFNENFLYHTLSQSQLLFLKAYLSLNQRFGVSTRLSWKTILHWTTYEFSIQNKDHWETSWSIVKTWWVKKCSKIVSLKSSKSSREVSGSLQELEHAILSLSWAWNEKICLLRHRLNECVLLHWI